MADRRRAALVAATAQRPGFLLGVLRAAREAGRDVPGDLSVVGFDDAPHSAYAHPALTTVRLDFEGLGRGCFGMLHRLLEPDTAPPLPLWAEPELIVRAQSGRHLDQP
jgi:DNA-binding LacI/PurR family transcriptional regulator